MSYSFPPSLENLRRYLKSRGFSGASIKTSRQAAFVAQQLLGTRVKFPPQGSDMTPTLLSLQAAIGGVVLQNEIPREAFPQKAGKVAAKPRKAPRAAKTPVAFASDMFAEGIHIFCDGAAVPNPGLGGWGVVVFEDGAEIFSAHGGEAEATNNQMELTAILNAIDEAWKHVCDWGKVTIWSDSQYCVRGVNEWMPGWKSKGWQRGSDKAEPKNRELANAELWKAIDAMLEGAPNFGEISIQWVKGHIGIAGNERADELAEMGRQEVAGVRSDLSAPADDLDERYRQIMGAA